MLLFEPAGTPRAAVVLFHGGALTSGAPEDMARHCEALAADGVLAASAGYRLLGQGAEHIGDCLDDVREAMAEFRRVAASASVVTAGVPGVPDVPDRTVAAGGSSAGAHLVALAALTGAGLGFDALVLLNPIVDTTLVARDVLDRALGSACGGSGSAESISPLHQVRAGSPRTAVFHGTADAIAPVESVRRFRGAMLAAGNVCELTEFEGARHAFHYDDAYFEQVIAGIADFL